MGWLSNAWSFRKSHIINSASGAGTNYQVKIIVHYGSGTDSDADVYLNSHCRTDFGDVRFTKSDGTTLIDYWIESYTASSVATFWVEVPDDLSSASATIYIYYGNPNATSLSNADAVFNYFDQGDKFYAWTQGSYSCTNDLSDGNPSPSYKAPSGSGYYMYKDVGLAPNMAIIFNVKTTGLGNLFFLANSSGKGQMYRLDTRESPYSSGFAPAASWTSWYEPSFGFKALVNVWYKLVIVITSSTSADLYYSQTTDRSPANFGTKLGTFTITNDGSIIGLVGDALGTSYYTWWDNIIVRKYVSPEPAHSTWGIEENYSFIVTDSGQGAETLIAPSFVVDDSGQGIDSLSSLSATVSVSDSGQGVEGTIPIILYASDSGQGIESIPNVYLSFSDVGSGVESIYGRIAQKPLLYFARITITDSNRTERQVNPLNLNLKFSREYAHEFDMTLKDFDGAISSWISEGQIVKVYIYLKDGSRQGIGREELMLLGQIEEIEPKVPTPSERYLVVKGRDRFSIDTVNRVVTESYLNKEISYIVKDLMSKYIPDVDTTTYVQNTGIILDTVIFSYRNLKDCLDTLASVCGYVYYCTPDLKLHWEPKEIKDTGLVLKDNEDIYSVPDYVKSIIPTKNVVYVIGGKYMQEDLKVENPSSYVSLESYYYARPFVADRADVAQISLYLAKVGNPSDLTGYIRDNNNGVPGKNVVSFTYDADYVGSAGWYPLKAKANLVVGDTYWIVLAKNGDANNTYRWYYKSSTADKYCYSSDGLTWNAVTNTNAFCFKTYYEAPVIVRVADSYSKQVYRTREEVITDSNITDINTAKKIAQARLDEMKDNFVELDEIVGGNVYPIPNVGELLGVNIPRLNVNDKFEIKEMNFEFKGGQEITGIKFRLGDTVTKLFLYLSNLKKTLDLNRVGKIGEGVLNLFRDMMDSVSVTDSVNTTIQASGTFVVDNAKVDFSEAG